MNVRQNILPRSIVAYCERALEIYGQQHYRRDFGFIDHVQPVADKLLCTTLDALVFADLVALVGKQPSDLHLAIPDILAPNDDFELGYFGIGLKRGKKASFRELAIEDYVEELQRGDMSAIRKRGLTAALHAGHPTG